MYEFMFLNEDIGHITLPVAPSQIAVRTVTGNRTVSLVELGEVNILKDAGLLEYSFNVLLPGRPFRCTSESMFMPPNDIVRFFRRIMEQRSPFRFIVNRALPFDIEVRDINMVNTMASVEGFTATEKAGEEGDIYIALTIKEHRLFSSRLMDVDEVGGLIRGSERPGSGYVRTYTVQPGDSLWVIARRFLNDGSRFGEIARLNNIPNPNRIFVGQVLKLPD